jgi:predicted DNA-binding transcriptional regulator AlpA
MSQKFLNVRAVCARYSNISDRTVDRWLQSGVLPKPLYIQGHRYWSSEQLDERDKARLAAGRPNEEAA